MGLRALLLIPLGAAALTAADANLDASIAKYKEIFTSHFNAGVIEASFKWHDTEFNFPGQRSKYYQAENRQTQLTPEEEKTKAEALRQYYRICFAHPALTGIMMWGFWEGANWIPQSSLYRRDWTPTPAADAYKDLVLNRWWTRWNGSANADGLVTVRAFYGKHRVTVNGKETIVELKQAEGSKLVDMQ